MKIKTFFFALIFLSSFNTYAQSETKLINEQVWEVFSMAFQTLDYEMFASIHHPSFIRINGNQDIIKSREEYLSTYENNWEYKDRKLKIDFRFLERITNNDFASERGIYKMTINPDTQNSASYYGKFQVLMKKEKGKWQLTVDYDSDENGTIGEDDFQAASPM